MPKSNNSDMNTDNLLGSRLKEDIKVRGKRLDEASAEAGMSPAYFSLVTQGKRTPSAERLERIIDQFTLDVTRYWQWVRPAYLIQRLQEEEPPATHPFWAESGLRILRRTSEPKVNLITDSRQEDFETVDHVHNYQLIPKVEGSIACGPPSEVQNHAVGYLPVYNHILGRHRGPFSCVEAEGDSMSPIIEEGSLCVIDHGQQEANALRGQVVAFNVDGYCTIKRLKVTDDGRYLIGDPENSVYNPVMIDLSDQEHNPIIGKVIWSDLHY